MGLIDDMLSGDERALSRLMTIIENDMEARKQILKRIHNRTGKAHIIGFTGPPGIGKSTLVSQVAAEYLNRNKRVGVVAIDPSSPFSLGAILGDRIRMTNNEGKDHLFIRSLASRGKLGGLSLATNDTIKLLEAFGKDVILVETVGIGQSEVDIAKTAHTTVVVLAPELGDDIQSMKAGVLEIGDLFVVNKSDLDGAHRAYVDLKGAIALNFKESKWLPKVFKVIAKEGEGIGELVDNIDLHYKFVKENDLLESFNHKRILNDIENNLINWVQIEVMAYLKEDKEGKMFVEKIYEKELDEVSTIEQIIKRFVN